MVSNMDLSVDLKICKMIYISKDGDCKALEVKEIEKYVNENGEVTEIVYLQDKGKKE